MSENTGMPLKPPIYRLKYYQLRIIAAFALSIILFLAFHLPPNIPRRPVNNTRRNSRVSSTISRCQQLSLQAGPSSDFYNRHHSDRFEPGTKPVLVKRAKIWTGAKNGTEVIHGDVLLDKGLIKSVGKLAIALLEEAYGNNLIVIDAKDAWLTPGIVDIHSHLGNAASPALDGAEDDNSVHGTIQPWLRSIDGLNTHDDSYPLSIAGGVTTSLVLPGSADAIGGQAFVIKLRETSDRSPSSMLLEPPYQINNSFLDSNLKPRWRHMKHACGENPDDVYQDTRMDTIWAFREAYNKAQKIKEEQDEFCSAVLAGNWEHLDNFPEDLQWEALVDVLRGRVKVNIHCYEAVDLDGLVRLSNEFKFPIAAFHHASEAYLVPELLKKAFGKTPAIALFATNGRYKREAYRASEFAPRILANHGLTVLMKSDHPVLNSRYLLYEAQQAYYYGLPENLALASVTANSAEVMGMGHRIGYVKEGWDADLVIWDSHPLALGATPTQVFIDGIPQLESPYVAHKSKPFQETPRVPNFDKEAREAVEYEGLPPLGSNEVYLGIVVFINVKTVYRRLSETVRQVFYAQTESELGVVVTRHGSIVCSGKRSTCFSSPAWGEGTIIDLEGGSVSPSLVSFGSPVGLQHIDQEESTNDGVVYDPLNEGVPKILGGDNSIIRAVDGLEYGSRNALLAYRAGVTSAIVAPIHEGFYGGLGTYFSLGAAHKLEDGAVIQTVTGVHLSIRHFSSPSISTQIAALRRLLLGNGMQGEAEEWFKKVIQGDIPLIVEAHSADIIATLVMLKNEVESKTNTTLKLTISGAAEAHILAQELGQAGVGVILTPSRPFPYVWEDRRILPGPPISKDSAISKLLSHNVTVGIGCEEAWSARNLPFDIAWAAIEADGKISKEDAFALGSSNLENLLGVEVKSEELTTMVATCGGDLLEPSSKVAAIISPSRKLVEIF